jgi:hypothetical protein
MSKQGIPMNLVQNIVFAVRYALKYRSWVVVVCPDDAVVRQCRQVLAGAVPDDAGFSGRTALLGEGARVSVVQVDSDVFVPEDDTFETLFVGWLAGKTRDARMSNWYENTSAVLREQPL